MRHLLHWLALVLLCATGACAAESDAPQVRILVYGVDDLADCAEPIQALQAELRTLPYPSGWTIGIVCTPVAWEALLRIADPPPTRSAFSNFIRRSTVINAAIFRQIRSSYHHTLLHELAHVTCQCTDEHKAEQLARKLERTPPTPQLHPAPIIINTAGAHRSSTQ